MIHFLKTLIMMELLTDDNDFKDSDYFESTYDVEDNLHTKEEATQKTGDKPSILGQIRAYQEESKTEGKQTAKEQEYVR